MGIWQVYVSGYKRPQQMSEHGRKGNVHLFLCVFILFTWRFLLCSCVCYQSELELLQTV